MKTGENTKAKVERRRIFFFNQITRKKHRKIRTESSKDERRRRETDQEREKERRERERKRMTNAIRIPSGKGNMRQASVIRHPGIN